MTKMCSRCGTQNPLDAKTCSKCGKALKRPMLPLFLCLLMLIPFMLFGQTKKDTVVPAGEGLSLTDPHNMSFITIISPKDYKRHNLIVLRPDTLTITQIYIERDTLKVMSSLPLDKAAEHFFFVLYKNWLDIVSESKLRKDSK